MNQFMYCYGFITIVWILLISLLGLTHFSYIHCMIQCIILLLYSYYGHIFAHYISEYPPFDYLNPHVSVHHNKVFRVSRWLNLTIESLSTFILFVGILKIQGLFNLNIFSSSIVIAACLLYIIIHILDYSILGNEEHRQHHLKNNCNYEPAFLDALFKTRCDVTKEFQNKNYQCIHLVLAVSATFILKIIYKLD